MRLPFKFDQERGVWSYQTHDKRITATRLERLVVIEIEKYDLIGGWHTVVFDPVPLLDIVEQNVDSYTSPAQISKMMHEVVAKTFWSVK